MSRRRSPVFLKFLKDVFSCLSGFFNGKFFVLLSRNPEFHLLADETAPFKRCPLKKRGLHCLRRSRWGSLILATPSTAVGSLSQPLRQETGEVME